MKSPFKFLDSYTKEDRDIFFGREKEIAELYRRVFDSSILVVYGISGTGKSSLIHCGLASKFSDSDWLNVNIRRGKNLIRSMAEAIETASLKEPGTSVKVINELDDADDTNKKITYFRKAVKNLYLDHYKPIYFILDQFEELFIFGTKEEDECFIKVLQSLLASDLQCKFIFIIREEYLGWLTTFEKSIPGFFNNRIRIEKMDFGNAKSAIEGPCKIHNIAVEEGFSENMLRKLCPPNESEIELTYLQVFLDKVYKLASKRKIEGSIITFRNSDLNKAGNVYNILGNFLDDQISNLPDPDTAMIVLKAFVSTRGTKRPVNTEEIREYALTTGKDIAEKTINDLLISFVNLRILQDKDHTGRNELKHDALATKIFEKVTLVEKELIDIKQFIETAHENWNKRGVLLSDKDLSYIAPYEDKLFLKDELKSFISKSKWEYQRLKHRRINIFIASAIGLLVAFACFTIWALIERSNSRKQEIIARSNYYNALSKELVNNDPTKALRISEYSYNLNPSEDNYQNLVDIYSNNEFYHSYLPTESTNVNSFEIINKTGNIVVKAGKKILTISPEGNKVQEVVFGLFQDFSFDISPDEEHFLLNTNDDTLRIFRKSGVLISNIPFINDLGEHEFLPDSKRIIVIKVAQTQQLLRISIFSLSGDLISEREEPLPTSGCFLNYISSDTIYYITNSNELNCWISSKNKVSKTQLRISESEITYYGLLIPNDRIVTISSHDTLRIYDMKGNILNLWYAGNEYNSELYQPIYIKELNILCIRDDKGITTWNMEGQKISTLKFVNSGYNLTARYNEYSHELLVLYQGKIISYVPNVFQDRLILKKENLKTNYFCYDKVIIAITGSEQSIITLDNENTKTRSVKFQDDKFYYKIPKSSSVIYHFPDNYKIPEIPEVTIYNIYNNEPLIKLKGLVEMPGLIIFSKDENLIASSHKLVIYDDGSTGLVSSTFFNLYDRDGELIRTFPLKSQTNPNIKISSDNKNILLAENNTAILLDTSGAQISRYIGHSLPVNTHDISDNGKFILTGSIDKTARLWTREGKTLKVINTDEKYFKLSFLPGESIFQIVDNNSVRLYDINGVLIQKIIVTNNNPIIYSPKNRSFYYTDNEGIHFAKMKEPVDKFLMTNNNTHLSIQDKIEYGILSVNDLLKSNDPGELFQAGNYFSELMNKKIDVSERNEAIKIAEKLFRRGLEFDTLHIQIARKLSDLSIIKYQYFNKAISNELEQYFKIIMREVDQDELVAVFTYYASSPNLDSIYIAFRYPEKAIEVAERILKLSPVNSRLRNEIAFRCSNLAFQLLDYKSQYKNSLNAALIAVKADSTYRNTYTNLPLAYILNNKYDEAEKIYLKWQDVPYTDDPGFNTFKDVFLSDFDDLERRGIYHPDFEKVRELLKK